MMRLPIYQVVLCGVWRVWLRAAVVRALWASSCGGVTRCLFRVIVCGCYARSGYVVMRFLEPQREA